MSDQLSNDLASLRIDRSQPSKGRSYISILLWTLGMGGVVGVGFVGYNRLSSRVFRQEVEVSEIALVSPAQASVRVTSTGYVVPQVSSKVGAKVPGRIAKVLVKEGDRVSVGQVLVELDDADQKTTLSAAQARIGAASARAQAAKASLREVEQQAAREKLLVDRGVTGRATLDDLIARSRSLVEQVKVAEAETRSASADAASLTVQLNDRRIVAPIDGTIISKPPEVGELVGPQLPAFLEIADFGSLVVETDVPEGRLSLVAPDSPCEIVLDAYPSKRHRGKVVEIGKRINRAKATAVVKVKFADSAENVLPDMSARVSFLNEELSTESLKEAPKKMVQAGAIAERNGHKVVFVIEDAKVHIREVTLGKVDASGIEILDGPASGTRIVANPSAELVDGQGIKEKGKNAE